jgi:hypothetical protein
MSTDNTNTSINIPRGFKFATNDLTEIHKSINQFRQKVSPISKEKSAKAHADISTNVIDMCSSGMDKYFPEETVPIDFSHKAIQERIVNLEREGYSDTAIDFACDCVVIPLKDITLGILYTEFQECSDIWFRKKIVEDYSFSNAEGFEIPEGITKAQWKKRGHNWKVALKNFNGIPALNGFLAPCVDRECYIMDDYDMILEYIPSFDARVEEMAVRRVALKNSDDKHVSPDVKDFFMWLGEGEGAELLAKEKEIVAPNLFPTITETRLTNHIK